MANVGEVVMTESLDPLQISHIMRSQQFDSAFRKSGFASMSPNLGTVLYGGGDGGNHLTAATSVTSYATMLPSVPGTMHSPLSPLTPTALLSPRSRDRAEAQRLMLEMDGDTERDMEQSHVPETAQGRMERSVRMERSAAARMNRAQRDADSQPTVWKARVQQYMD